MTARRRPVVSHRLVVLHRQLGRSLLLWSRRRLDGVVPGATPLPYGRDARVTAYALLAASLVEVVAVELVVPWPAVRGALLVLGVYGVVGVLAWIADLGVRPHVLTGEGLRLRAGSLAEVTLPLESIASAGSRLGAAEGTVALTDGVLTLAVGPQTTLEVRLREPRHVAVGRVAGTVSAVRVAADDPAVAAAAIRRALGDPDVRGSARSTPPR